VLQYVYVDEAQDLCMAQLGLVMLLCKDATTGLVIAGDTAQTITKGTQWHLSNREVTQPLV
jgi:superfamily I DNA/RNA helicase